MKKKVLTIVSILIALVLLVPVPIRYKDGGTVEYRAILYSVTDFKCLNDSEADEMYTEGTIVEILGIEVYNDVEWGF